MDLTSSILMTAQNARPVVYCAECEKPWVIYSRNKLNHNQCMLLAKIVSSFEYSCEAFLFSPDNKFKTAGILCIRPSLHCAMKTEVLYYGSDIDRADKCSHCRGSNAVVSQELKQELKTVLQCANRALKTERSLLHRDLMEREKADFFMFVNVIL